jgi:hypothetical protein
VSVLTILFIPNHSIAKRLPFYPRLSPCNSGNSDSVSSSVAASRMHAHKKSAHIYTYCHKPFSPLPLEQWQFGLCLVIGGSIADFVALKYADQSVVAPLGSLTMVTNTFLGRCDVCFLSCCCVSMFCVSVKVEDIGQRKRTGNDDVPYIHTLSITTRTLIIKKNVITILTSARFR